MKDVRVDVSKLNSPPEYLFLGVSWITTNYGGQKNINDLLFRLTLLIKLICVGTALKHAYQNKVKPFYRLATLVVVIFFGIFVFHQIRVYPSDRDIWISKELELEIIK